jgi:hypothetical protein
MDSEADTVQFEMTAYKYKGENRWIFGEAGYRDFMSGSCVRVDDFLQALLEGKTITVEELEYAPADILSAYLQFLFGTVERENDGMTIGVAAVCTGLFYRSFLDVLRDVLRKILPDTQLAFLTKEDCFAAYALSVKEELYRNYVALFEYDGTTLLQKRMELRTAGKRNIVPMEERSTAISGETDGEKDEQLQKAAEEFLHKEVYSAVYLTGKGFETEYSYDRFLTYVCGRRRVFLGQNLYSRGACFYILDALYGKNPRKYILQSTSHIPCDVDIELIERGVQKVYRIVYAGSTWYDAGKNADFIVKGNASLKINLTPPENRPAEQLVISLDSLPKRPDRATRIGVEVFFENESVMKVRVRDKGFGSFYKASDVCVERELNLREINAWMD